MTDRLTRFLALTSLILAAIVSATATSVRADDQLGAREPETWIKLLDAPARIAGLRVDEIVSRLGLKPGQVVADLGAGTGVFSLPMARAVAPSGRVYAVEIEQGLVDYIGQKASAEGVRNVQAMLGKPADPALPVSNVDLAFMHDVLHHIADRQAYVHALVKYLKPGARVAIVDYLPERSPHQGQPELIVSKDQARELFASAGLKVVSDIALFDDKWFLVFSLSQ
jgi:SAM-dependent methyltransferase